MSLVNSGSLREIAMVEQPVGEASHVGRSRSRDSIMCQYYKCKRLCMSYVRSKTT